MSSFQQKWSFAKAVARAFAHEARELVLPTCSIEMALVDDTRLVLRSSGREIVFNKRYGTVKSREQVLALFRDVRRVEVVRRRDDDRGDTWSVRLRISWFTQVHLGTTSDATEASIVGARVSGIVGKPVVALR